MAKWHVDVTDFLHLSQLNEQIAGYLPTDADIRSFLLTCHASYEAGEAARCGLWRRLFARKFDLPEFATGQDIKLTYKIRSRALRRAVDWKMGHELNEIKALDILTNLITGKQISLTPHILCTLILINIAISRSVYRCASWSQGMGNIQ